MKLTKSTLLVAAAIVCCVTIAVPVQSQPVKTSSVKFGDKVLVIPDPEGFEEASLQFEKVKQVLIKMETPDSDNLLLHMPVSDCERIRKGLRPHFLYYAKISVSKGKRESVSSNEDMARLVAGLRKNSAAIFDPDGPILTSVMEDLSRKISEASAQQTKYDVNTTQFLGEFDARPEVYSTLVFMTYTKNTEGAETVRAVVGSMTVMKVGARIFDVNIYRSLSSAEAAKTELKPAVLEVKQFTTKWVNEILAANRVDQ